MRYLILTLALCLSCRAQELTIEALKEGLSAELEAFEEVSIPSEGKATTLAITLGEKPVKIGKDLFDGFRFRCPKLEGGKDFVWYFNAPANWGNWYIVPVKEDPGQAFKGWLDGDKLYRPYDKPAEKDRLRILQTLDGTYFKEGSEYIMWFRKTGDGPATDLRGSAAFVKKEDPEDKWDHESVEEALALEEAAPADQVAALSSKGGLILLDPDFFDPGYAKGRIDSAFFSMRQTKRASGGFFITIQTATPPCQTEPSFKEIEKKYGTADFTRTGEEMDKRATHTEGDPVDDDEKGITHHYYDYFAFETESGSKDPKVLRVRTHGTNFSALRAPEKGSSWVVIDTENLVVFHKDGKEVGRAYYFLEGEKKPLFITEPPAGEYSRSKEDVLIVKGKGAWLWETRYPDGKIGRRIPFKDNRMHGKAEGFYPDGKPEFTAEYRAGNLDGEVVKFDKAGKETSRRKFKDGEPAED